MVDDFSGQVAALTAVPDAGVFGAE